jgi:hypothetical protein
LSLPSSRLSSRRTPGSSTRRWFTVYWVPAFAGTTSRVAGHAFSFSRRLCARVFISFRSYFGRSRRGGGRASACHCRYVGAPDRAPAVASSGIPLSLSGRRNFPPSLRCLTDTAGRSAGGLLAGPAETWDLRKPDRQDFSSRRFPEEAAADATPPLRNWSPPVGAPSSSEDGGIIRGIGCAGISSFLSPRRSRAPPSPPSTSPLRGGRNREAISGGGNARSQRRDQRRRPISLRSRSRVPRSSPLVCLVPVAPTALLASCRYRRMGSTISGFSKMQVA